MSDLQKVNNDMSNIPMHAAPQGQCLQAPSPTPSYLGFGAGPEHYQHHTNVMSILWVLQYFSAVFRFPQTWGWEVADQCNIMARTYPSCNWSCILHISGQRYYEWPSILLWVGFGKIMSVYRCAGAETFFVLLLWVTSGFIMSGSRENQLMLMSIPSEPIIQPGWMAGLTATPSD